MRIAEIRQLSKEELQQRVIDMHDDIFRLRFQLKSGQLQNYRRIREAKREIANIKTVLQNMM